MEVFMGRKHALVGVILVLISSLSLDVQAAPSAGTYYFGPLAGISSFSDDVGTKFGVGAHGGSQFHELMSAGLYVTYSSLGDETQTILGNTFNLSQSFWVFALEGNYELKELLDGAYVGAKVGAARTSASASIPDVDIGDSTDLVFGPALGYRRELQSNFTVGGEASFLVVTTDDTVTLWNLLGTLTYWF